MLVLEWCVGSDQSDLTEDDDLVEVEDLTEGEDLMYDLTDVGKGPADDLTDVGKGPADDLTDVGVGLADVDCLTHLLTDVEGLALRVRTSKHTIGYN